jgi:amidohydrolase
MSLNYMPSTLELAKTFEPELIALRRDFHQNPEIAFEEVRTGKLIGDYCEALGLEVHRNAAKTGIVVNLNPNTKGPVLALRADIDALPIEEENEVAYKSSKQGKGHLCGHDAHTAMLMGAVKILSKYKDKVPFPVRFLFQPAEEIPKGGAEELIKEGFLENVSEIFGLHVFPSLPTGTLGVCNGAMMASMDRVEITIEGRGGHGAFPHQCLDPVTTAAEIILALQSIVSRRVDPMDPAVVSITQINAGHAFNVIPQKAELIGTCRSLSKEVWKQLPLWIEEISTGIAKAHGQKAIVNYIRGTTVLVNEKTATEKLSKTFQSVGGSVVDFKPMMGGEDFAYYLEKIPGSFAFLGTHDGTSSTQNGLHHPKFNIDEKALPWGTATFVELVLSKAGLKA